MARPRSFERLARGVVASVLALVDGGCGLDLEGMQEIPCKDGAFDALGDVRLAEEVDSLELVAFDETDTARVVATRGTRCAAATDTAACLEAVGAFLGSPDAQAQMAPPSPFILGDCAAGCEIAFLIATRGDDVIPVGYDDVRALFVPIDTPTEVAWIAGLAEYQLACGNADVTGVRKADAGWEMAARRQDTCPMELTQELLAISPEGGLEVLDTEVVSSNEACAGRRPSCASTLVGRGVVPLGAHLAVLAQLEAESVPAFAELALELAALGAPRSLVRRARRARLDELRHARIMTGLAKRHGGRPVRSSVPRAPLRSLVDVALANVREGCVREAFGAIIGRWQAHRAGDPAIRSAMRSIARDEAAHASLSFAVDAWARRELDPHGRARLARARAEALATLRAEVAREAPNPQVAAALGLPSSAEAQLLLDAFARSSV